MKVFVTFTRNIEKIREIYPDNTLIYNPKYIINKKQAEFAAILALKAFENGQNIANKLPIEFLVRLSGEKQIKKALSFGMAELEEYAGIVILNGDVPDNMEEISYTPQLDVISGKYRVEKKELEKRIYEKMALVDI